MSLENFHPAGYFARLTLMSPRCTTSMWTPPFSTCSSGWSSERLSPLVVVDMSVLLHVRRSRDPTPATAWASSVLAHEGRDAADLAARDLAANLVHRGHVGLRHLRADPAEPDAVVLQAEDRVPAAPELAADDVLDRQV